MDFFEQEYDNRNDFKHYITNFTKRSSYKNSALGRSQGTNINQDFLGFGYDSYGSINPIFQSPKVREIRSRLLDNSHQTFVPLVGHGHSDLLEHISEFGWVGFSLSFLPLLLISMRNFLFDPSIFNQSISGGILCFLAYCCIDFPTRSPACLILISLLAGLSLKYNQLSLSK